MANEEHVRRLKEKTESWNGTASWNRWRKMNPGIQPDLSGDDLNEANLNGANLYRTDLSEANLNGANLNGADLGETNISEVDLRTAKGLTTIYHFRRSYIELFSIQLPRMEAHFSSCAVLVFPMNGLTSIRRI